MSLHATAQHLAAHGRGNDKVLVHMTPGEVRSLQDLAMAHGGSLTTNPHTGLPEAGFLSSILPVAAGIALNAAFPGLGAMGTAALVGGGTALMTGSLGQGLMAGLGAYGGGNLGEALAKQGMEQAALNTAAEQAGVEASKTVGALAPSSQFMGGTTDIFGNLPGQAGFQSDLAFKSATAPDLEKLTTYGKALSDAGYGGPMPTGMAGIEAAGRGFTSLAEPGGLSQYAQNLGGTGKAMQTGLMASAPLIAGMGGQGMQPVGQSSGPNPYRYRFERGEATPFPQADRGGIEMSYFPNARYVPYAGGGPVEAMSDANAVGANTGFPMADISRGAYATPYQQPISQNVVTGAQDTRVDPTTGEERLARGGLSNLGDYSDGGRLLRGPGDGVSDSIPATIGNRRPARLADGEFVVPARIVSELGNGSTEAGARKLYAMMDRVQKARSKTVGKGKVAKRTNADNLMPA